MCEPLPFEVSGYREPSPHDERIALGDDVAIYERFQHDEDRELTSRGYEAFSPHAATGVGTSKRRAFLAAALLERFGVDLTESREPDSGMGLLTPGVPVAVAADGKPALATWLFVRGWHVDEIADELDVGEATVSRYFSRIRSDSSFSEGE